MNRYLLSCIILIFASVAFALPPLVAYEGQGLSFKIPQGWSVDVDETGSYVIVAENPNDPNAAALVLIAVPYQTGFTAQSLSDSVLTEIAAYSTELRRQEDNGVVWTLHEFENEGVKGLLSSMAFVSAEQNTAVIGLMSAKTEDFEKLGGTSLLFVTFGGADPNLFNQPAAVSAVAQQATFPGLEPITELDNQYYKPRGWHYTAEQSQGQSLIYLLEDPSNNHSPAIFWLMQDTPGAAPAGTDVVSGAVETFLSSLGIENPLIERSSGDLVSGGRMISGYRAGIAYKAFFIVNAATSGSATLQGIVAPSERFAQLGGHGLLAITLMGMSLAEFEQSSELQAWYYPPSFSASGTNSDYAMQQMYLDMQDRMFKTWSNNLGGNYCWADSYGTCY